MPPRYVRRRLSGSTSSPCANPSKLTEEQPSQPFPLLRLSPEILLRISTFWCEHPLGLPTESLNRQLYTVLSDPVAIAQRTLRRFKTVQIGFEYEVLRAESNGDFRATTILLDKGASVHKPPRRELTLSALLSMFLLHDHWILDTPLSRACRYRASKAVKYLLERGADVDGLNFQGVSPIGYASLKGNWEILELLLSLGAQTTQSCLQNAVQAQRVQHVELILEHTSSEILATWEGLGDTHFLLIACQRENIDIVRLLLKYNVPVDSGSTSNNDDDDPINATGLIIACDKGNDSLARLLIEHGADVNVNNGVKNGMTPILAACVRGHISTVQILLDAGAKVNHGIDKGSALFFASGMKGVELVRLLIEKGADIEKGSVVGLFAPLQNAATVEIAQLILQMGVDINARDGDGVTAVRCALQNGNAPVLAFLLDQGADITMKDNRKKAPLSYLSDLDGEERQAVLAVLQDRGLFRRSSRLGRG